MRADARRNRARVLAAAEQVFAAKGASASTEEIAKVAGVGIGTVFRHFPTKKDLLAAIMKDRLDGLFAETESLIADGDPGSALETFFARVVELAGAKKTVVDLLAAEGVDLEVDKPLQLLQEKVEALLTNAQRAGSVRADARVDEVMALLRGLSQAAMTGGWSRDLAERTVAIVIDGLRSRPGH